MHHWAKLSGLPLQRVEELQRRWCAGIHEGEVLNDLKFVFRITAACRIPKEANELITDMFNFCVREIDRSGSCKIRFEEMIRILGVFQMASVWHEDSGPS